MPITKRSLETETIEPTILTADESGIDLLMSMTEEAPFAELDGVNATDVADALDIVAIPTNTTEIETTFSDNQLGLIDMSSNNDTASIVAINNPIEPIIFNTTDLDITEATTLPNVINDLSDGMRAGRSWNTADAFPNELAIILKNDPIAHIKQYKLQVNQIIHEIYNQQQQYGLSECLFEPLEKLGEAFKEVYSQKHLNQTAVDCYFEFISALEKNASHITPENCSDATHWSLSTTTSTPLASTEPTSLTTEYVTEALSIPSSVTTQTTTEVTAQSTNSTTPINALDEIFPVKNTTTNINDIYPNTTITAFNNNLIKLGLTSGGQGIVAGVIHGITRSLFNNALVNMFANAATLATLPVMLSTVDDESEQSNSLNKILAATAYSLGSSLILSGVSFAAQRGYSYFNKKPMNKDSIGSKALDALPLLANTSLLINAGYNLTEATVIVGTNVVGAGVSSALTQSLWNFARNKIKNYNNQDKDVEKGFANNNNNIEMDLVKTSAVAFEQDNFNLDSQFQTLATEAFNSKDKDTSKLDAFLAVVDKMPYFEIEKVCTKDLVLASENQLKMAEKQAKDTLDTSKKAKPEEKLAAQDKSLLASSAEKRAKAANNAAKKADEKMTKIHGFFLQNLTLLALQTPQTAVWAFHYLLSQKRLLPTSKDLQTCSVVPFTVGESENIANTNITILQKLLASFIYGLKLKINDFKFESNVKEFSVKGNIYCIDRLMISYGTEITSIFTPIDITLNKPVPIFDVIKVWVDKQAKNKSTLKSAIKSLFLLHDKSATAMVEIITYPSSSELTDKISVHNPDGLLKNKLKQIANISKKYSYIYSFNREINNLQYGLQEHSLFATYYFMKENIKTHLKICLLPNNNQPDLFDGLLATFIHSLKIQGLQVELSSLNTLDAAQLPKRTTHFITPTIIERKGEQHTEEDSLAYKLGFITETVNRNKKDLPHYSNVSLNNRNVSIFSPIQNNLNGNLSTTKILKYLLNNQQSNLKKNNTAEYSSSDDTRHILLPLTDEKGMAVIEIVTNLSGQKIVLIHDPKFLLESITETIKGITEKSGSTYSYNPNENYSSNWKSAENCQLAAYYHIKNAINLCLFPNAQINLESPNNKNIAEIVLTEVKSNLDLQNEYKFYSYAPKIKKCNGGDFNLLSYITNMSNYFKVLSIDIASTPTNKSELNQTIAVEMQQNLGLKNSNIDLLQSSTLEILAWDSIRFDKWSELFATKKTALPDVGTIYHLVEAQKLLPITKNKMAVLANKENSENPILSAIIRSSIANKKSVTVHDLLELFSKLSVKEENKQTKVYLHNISASFFQANSSTVAPVQPNHSTPEYK